MIAVRVGMPQGPLKARASAKRETHIHNAHTMDKENLEFLKERLYFLGFIEKLNKALEDKMKTGDKEFKLAIDADLESKGATKNLKYVLDFAKSDKQDRYFLNSYTATMKNGDSVEASQKIFLNYGSGMSARESFNLLEGRSVHKTLKNREGEPYNAWLKIDVTQQDKYGNNKLKPYTSGWNYDLSSQLHKLPIKELQDNSQKDELLYKLKKGDLVSVNFVIDKQDVKRYIEANPAGRNVLIYDEKFALLNAPKEKKQEERAARQERSGGMVFNDPEAPKKAAVKEQGKDLVEDGPVAGKAKKNGRGV